MYFPGNFNFQGLFKTVLHIQVLFQPVRTLWIYPILKIRVDPDKLASEKTADQYSHHYPHAYYLNPTF